MKQTASVTFHNPEKNIDIIIDLELNEENLNFHLNVEPPIEEGEDLGLAGKLASYFCNSLVDEGDNTI